MRSRPLSVFYFNNTNEAIMQESYAQLKWTEAELNVTKTGDRNLILTLMVTLKRNLELVLEIMRRG